MSPVLIFCPPRPVWGGTKGAGSNLCFALPDSFWAVKRALGLVFLFRASVLDFDVTGCVGSRFHVLRSRTCFRRYRGRRVPFSCFALSDTFSTVAKSHFHVLRPRTRFGLMRASGPIFRFCAPEPVLDSTEGAGSSLNVLLSRNRLGWY
jgi:hypothetical protein